MADIEDAQGEPVKGQPNIRLIQSAFEQLFQMVRRQDDLIHSWTKFYLSIQAGLAVALSFLIRLGSSQAQLVIAGNLAIPFLGIATTIVLTKIIVREHFWQGRYIVQITKLPAMPETFRRDWVPGEPDENKRGYNAQQFCGLRNILVAGWATWGIISGIIPLYRIFWGS